MTDNVALVVDDTPANLDFMERLLTHARFTVRGAASGATALEKVADVDNLALAVVDMQLPDMNGLRLITELRRQFPDACLVIATMYDDISLMEKAFANGCDIFLVKPHGFMELFKRLTTMGIGEIREDPQLVIDQYGPHSFRVAVI